MVPAGWDSHGKIHVLRDRFDPNRVLKAWEVSLAQVGREVDEGEEESMEDLWIEMIPDTSRPKVSPSCPSSIHRRGAQDRKKP